MFESDDQNSLAAVDKRTSHRRRPPTSVPYPDRTRGLDSRGLLGCRAGGTASAAWLTRVHFSNRA